MSTKVQVVATGSANLASVLAAFERQGTEPVVTRDPGAVTEAPYVVLPGVGAFAAARRRLDEAGVAEAVRERVEAGHPTLAICLGLQLLCEGSEESPGVPGLECIPGRITRLPDSVRVPQLGWNRVEPEEGCRLLEPGHAVFANSYCLVDRPKGWCSAITDHGGPFVAAVERGAVLACQFHPELSGPWGAAILRRWLGAGEGEATSC